MTSKRNRTEATLTRAASIVDAKDAVVKAAIRLALVNAEMTQNVIALRLDRDAWDEFVASLTKLDETLAR